MENILNQLPSIKKRSLLIVEDSDADFEALNRTLKKIGFNNSIYRVTDGDEALDYIFHFGEYQNEEIAPEPTLIMLDLNLPGTDGREVLAKMKEDESSRKIPVIVFSTSSNPEDIETCYKWGANSYMLKPMDINDLQKTLKLSMRYWFEVVVLPNS
ncbi:MAG: response regulator [Cyanobacteriota bacterium]|nr:response regulator [Cyanobacteriota bacterium]